MQIRFNILNAFGEVPISAKTCCRSHQKSDRRNSENGSLVDAASLQQNRKLEAGFLITYVILFGHNLIIRNFHVKSEALLSLMKVLIYPHPLLTWSNYFCIRFFFLFFSLHLPILWIVQVIRKKRQNFATSCIFIITWIKTLMSSPPAMKSQTILLV